jgi:hypothetical protein
MSKNPYREIDRFFREGLKRHRQGEPLDEWQTAEALQARFGGSLDYVKRVADHCLFVKLTAIHREGPHGRAYRPSFHRSIDDKMVDRSEP